MKLIVKVLIATIILSGCGKQSQEGEKSSDLEPITIAQFGHVFLYMPLYVALRKGYFEEEGLKTKLVSTGGDEKTFTAVASGNAQFGVADPVFVAVARQRGQGGKVVASIVRGVPFWVVAESDSIKPFDNASGFSGMRVGTYTAPSTSYAVMKEILQNNDHPVDAKIVEGAFGSLLPMLKANQADVVMTIEPMVSIAKNEGAHIVYSPARVLGDFAFTGLTVSEKYHQEHPDKIESAVRAIARAMNYIHTDFEGALEVAKEEFPEVSPVVLKDALKRLIDQGTIPATPELSKEAWDKAVALRKEIGDLKGKGSFAENVDPSFAEKAVSESDPQPSRQD